MKKLLLLAFAAFFTHFSYAQCEITLQSVDYYTYETHSTTTVVIGNDVTSFPIGGTNTDPAVFDLVQEFTSPGQDFLFYHYCGANGVFTSIQWDFDQYMNEGVFIANDLSDCGTSDGSICSPNGESFTVNGVASVGGCVSGLAAGAYEVIADPIVAYSTVLGYDVTYTSPPFTMYIGATVSLEENTVTGELEVLINGAPPTADYTVTDIETNVYPLNETLWGQGCNSVVVSYPAQNGQIPCQITHTEYVGCFGDFDGNGAITAYDLSQFMGNYGTSNAIGDLNCDGFITAYDMSVFLAAYGTSCN